MESLVSGFKSFEDVRLKDAKSEGEESSKGASKRERKSRRQRKKETSKKKRKKDRKRKQAKRNKRERKSKTKRKSSKRRVNHKDSSSDSESDSENERLSKRRRTSKRKRSKRRVNHEDSSSDSDSSSESESDSENERHSKRRRTSRELVDQPIESFSKGFLPLTIQDNPAVSTKAPIDEHQAHLIALQSHISRLRRKVESDKASESTWLELLSAYEPLGSSHLAMKQYHEKLSDLHEEALRYCRESPRIKVRLLASKAELADSAEKRIELQTEWLLTLRKFFKSKLVHDAFLVYLFTPLMASTSLTPHFTTLVEKKATIESAFKLLLRCINEEGVNHTEVAQTQILMLGMLEGLCLFYRSIGQGRKAVVLFQAVLQFNAEIHGDYANWSQLVQQFKLFWTEREESKTMWHEWKQPDHVPLSACLRLAIQSKRSGKPLRPNELAAREEGRVEVLKQKISTSQEEKKDESRADDAYQRALSNLGLVKEKLKEKRRAELQKKLDRDLKNMTPNHTNCSEHALAFDPAMDPLLRFLSLERQQMEVDAFGGTNGISFEEDIRPFLFIVHGEELRWEVAKRFLRFVGVVFPFQDFDSETLLYHALGSGRFDSQVAGDLLHAPFIRGPLAPVHFPEDLRKHPLQVEFIENALYYCLDHFDSASLAWQALVVFHSVTATWKKESAEIPLLVSQWLFNNATEDCKHDLLVLWYSIDFWNQKLTGASPLSAQEFLKANDLTHASHKESVYMAFFVNASVAAVAVSNEEVSVGFQSLSHHNQATFGEESVREAFRSKCKSELDNLRSMVTQRTSSLGDAAIVLNSPCVSCTGLAKSVLSFAWFELMHGNQMKALNLLAKSTGVLADWFKLQPQQGSHTGRGSKWCADVSSTWLFLCRASCFLAKVAPQPWLRKQVLQNLENDLKDFPSDPWLLRSLFELTLQLPLTLFDPIAKRLSKVASETQPSSSPGHALLVIFLEHIRVEKIFHRTTLASCTEETEEPNPHAPSFFPLDLNLVPTPSQTLRKEVRNFSKSASCIKTLRNHFEEILGRMPQHVALQKLYTRFLLSCGELRATKTHLENAVKVCAASKEMWIYLLETLRPYMLWTENRFEREVFERMESTGIIFLQQS